jgi:hypothetical protein
MRRIPEMKAVKIVLRNHKKAKVVYLKNYQARKNKKNQFQLQKAKLKKNHKFKFFYNLFSLILYLSKKV